MPRREIADADRRTKRKVRGEATVISHPPKMMLKCRLLCSTLKSLDSPHEQKAQACNLRFDQRKNRKSKSVCKQPRACEAQVRNQTFPAYAHQLPLSRFRAAMSSSSSSIERFQKRRERKEALAAPRPHSVKLAARCSRVNDLAAIIRMWKSAKARFKKKICAFVAPASQAAQPTQYHPSIGYSVLVSAHSLLRHRKGGQQWRR